VLIVASFVVYRIVQNYRATPTQTAGGRGGRGAGMGGPVPVVPGTVEKKDTPIYLNGIGTVQAFNTVTVQSRVDGEIKQIAFTEGQDVKAGDLLAQVDPAPYQAAYDQAVSKKAQDDAQLVNAHLNMTREEDLFAKKAVSTQERDAQRALTDQLEATVKADAAAITSAKVQLDYTRIVAPISGRTGIRLVDQGNVVHSGGNAGIVVLTQLQPISVVFTLREQDLVEIKKQNIAPTDFKVLATDRDTTTVLDTGILAVIDNQIDQTTGTIKLKATFPNDSFQLWPGQFINARLLLKTQKDGLIVPASAVQRGPQGTFVFVIGTDETVSIRPVKVGPIEQGEALIESGLEAGERVVVDGQYKLQPGSHVKILEAPAPGAGVHGAGQPGAGPRGAGAGAHAGGAGAHGGGGQHGGPRAGGPPK
jgi:multidrug efflux system membrane fusion protein